MARTLVACECKWTLQPADPSEVLNRRTVVRGKASQITTKLAAINANFDQVLRSLGINEPPGPWKVSGLIVIDGFSDDTDASGDASPLIPSRVFEMAFARCTSLGDAIDWIEAESWRPKEGLHYRLVVSHHSIGPVQFEWIGAEPIDLVPLLQELRGRDRGWAE